MAIELSCPVCGSTLRVGDDAAGRLIRCGGCLTMLRVPEEAPGAAAPLPPPAPEPDPLPDDAPPADRPRRRRRPPPPPGRSPLFWVVLALALIGLGTCACCGGVFLLLPGPSWRTHTSEPGGFTVELPAAARKNMRIPNMNPAPGVAVEGTVLWSRGELYAVVYGDLPPGRADADAVLDAAVKAIGADPQCRRVVRADPVRVSGFPAREVEYLATDGGTYVARLVVADRREYRAIAGGRFVKPGNANVRRFLDSFRVNDLKKAKPPADEE